MEEKWKERTHFAAAKSREQPPHRLDSLEQRGRPAEVVRAERRDAEQGEDGEEDFAGLDRVGGRASALAVGAAVNQAAVDAAPRQQQRVALRQ